MPIRLPGPPNDGNLPNVPGTATRGGSVHHLAPEPASVTDARRLAIGYAAELCSGEQLPKLELAVSEIVGNAVRHGAPDEDIKFAMTPKDGYLCVQVTDSGQGFVPKPGAIAAEDDGGFGLFLVERLTRRWGVTREAERTRVWFELDFA